MKQLLPLFIFCITTFYLHAQDLVINPAFGNKGFVTKAPEKRENILYELATSVIELPDGKLLLGVEVNGTTRLTRYMPDGSRDKTYGTDGYSETTGAFQTRIVRTAGGKILVAGIGGLTSQVFVVTCYDENGKLDKSFGNGGIKNVETGALQNELKSFKLQQDGKMLLGGRITFSDKKQAFVMRLLADGNADGSFANNGLLKIDAEGTTIVSGLAVAETSIIVGAGNDNDSQSDFVVLKYLLNGAPDKNFGDSGSTRINIGASEFLESIALQSDGKIIAAGEFGDIIYNRSNFALVRLLPNGKPDSTFNQTGVVTTSFGSYSHVLRTLIVDANMKIMISGVLQGSGTNFVFARFNEDGSLDNTFGDEGKKLWNIDQVGVDIYSGLLKSDGSFIGVGFLYQFTVPNSTLDYMLLHLSSEGRPDETFGTNGIVTGYLPAKSAFFDQPKLVANGKILSRYSASAVPWTQGLIRYLPNGLADENFADKGFLKTNSYLFDELPDKHLVTFEASNGKVVMKRYTQEGQTDYTLGNNGEKELPLFSNYIANAIKIQPDGKILMSGSYINQVGRQQGFLVRLDADGNLDKQFGQQGQVLFDLDRNEFIQQPVLQPDGKILVSGSFFFTPAYNSQFFVRRFTAAGLLDESFGKKGLIDGSYGLYSFLDLLLVQPDGKLLVSYVTRTNDNLPSNYFVQRYNQNGLPDESFGEKGRLKMAVNGAEVLKNGKILIATNIISQGKQNGALILLNPNGSRDQSFGVNGTKKFRFDKDNAYLYRLSVKDDKAYVNGAKRTGLDEEAFLGGFLIHDAAPGSSVVSSFTLVSAASGKDIARLKENAVIDLGSVSPGGLSIRANTIPDTVGSVVLELQGPQSKIQIESLLPYTLFGDDQKGMYYAGSLPSGDYTLTATPYSKAGSKGSAGTPLIIHFKMVYSAVVKSFTLINAATGNEVREIREGDILDVSSLPAKLNILVSTTPSRVGSVVLDLNGARTYNRIQNGVPYSLFGDNDGTYASGKLPVGDYTLTAVPYSESNQSGGNGKALTIHFKVIDPAIVHLLYGLTTNGGTNYTGVLFSFNAATATYTKLKDIGEVNGKYTNGSLTQGADGKLYGMTLQGGNLPYGSIFSFDPPTNTFASLQEFDFTNGAGPNGRLVQANNGKLYGTTNFGGTGFGNIFSFDPSTNLITPVREFSYYDGYAPNGSLVQATDGLLYGMTYAGGNNNLGVIFSFDPVKGEYKKLQDFNGSNGGSAFGSLIQASDGKLYGMSYSGGSLGAIFSFDPVSNVLTTRKYFDYADGAYPRGDLVQGNTGKLYGMTKEGGSSDAGVLFSFDPITSDYIKLFDFAGANGRYPSGSLIQASDGKLYGETTYGGSSDVGVLFSFDPLTNTYAKLKDFAGDDGAYPGFTNLIELSCKGTLYYRDADGDGYGDSANTTRACFSLVPGGYVLQKGDCNDSNAAIYPGASEICNGIDDNCNGIVDEDCNMGLSLMLVNPATGQDVIKIEDGAVIDLATLSSPRLNIRAITTPAKVGSVIFSIQGPLIETYTENLQPYALFGDDQKGNYNGVLLSAGEYTLTATPYSAANSAGTKGIPTTIHFSIVNGLPLSRTAGKGKQQLITAINGSKEISLTASPNPFSAETVIRFSLPLSSYATLQLCDLNGRTLASLFQGNAEGGKVVQAPLTRKTLAAGVYLVRLTTATQTITRKVVVTR